MENPNPPESTNITENASSIRIVQLKPDDHEQRIETLESSV